MRRGWLIAGVLALGACGNGKEHEHPDGGFVMPDEWWMPAPSETKNWDIQINAPFDFNTQRAMMIIDLWDSVPAATTIGSVAVPAGANASAIATLAAKQTVIICRVGLGGVNTTDPDFGQFPAAALGEPTPFDANDRYLDLAMRSTWEDAAFARLDLAKAIGCDGIEPYMADHDLNMTGFNETSAAEIAWGNSVASEAHDRKLSIGMRNGTNVGGLVDALVGDFDWLLIERCGEFGDCETVRPFINARKAVFGLDYTTDVDGLPLDSMDLCDEQGIGGVKDGIVKNVELTSATRTQCP